MKTIGCLFLALLLIVPRPALAEEKKLRVGMELAYPPFEMRDQRGEPAGVSVDLARALGEHLGMVVEIQNLPFDGLISEPYLKTGLCLLVGAKSDIRSIADADRTGRSIAVKKGTTGHLYALRALKAARPLVLENENACVLEVVQGKAEAFIYDQMSTFKNARKNPDTTRAILAPFQQEGWAIGLRKGHDDLRTKVNSFLAGYREKGGYEKLGDKWLGEQKAEFKKLGVPFYF